MTDLEYATLCALVAAYGADAVIKTARETRPAQYGPATTNADMVGALEAFLRSTTGQALTRADADLIQEAANRIGENPDEAEGCRPAGRAATRRAHHGTPARRPPP